MNTGEAHKELNDGIPVLVGRYRSPFTRRVAVSLKLLGFKYKLRQRTAWRDFDEITSLNPLGRVPILILENGETIFDSSAIVDYLNMRAGRDSPLTTVSGPLRRQTLRLEALALGIIDKGRELLYETVLRPEDLRHPPWIERFEGQIQSALEVLESNAGEPWVAGNRLSQADIAVGVMIDFIRLHHADLLPGGVYARLDELATQYDLLPAFSETKPELV